MNDTSSPLFLGTGTEQRNNHQDLPQYKVGHLNDPKHYQASPNVVAAVNVALTLGMPLLLTGEPGCGKSELAQRLAWEMGFPAIKPDVAPEQRVLSFSVKSTTEARDLFYRYDAVGRFHAAQMQQFARECPKERA